MVFHQNRDRRYSDQFGILVDSFGILLDSYDDHNTNKNLVFELVLSYDNTMIPTLEEMDQEVYILTDPNGHTYYTVRNKKPIVIDDSTRLHPSLRPIAAIVEELVGLGNG